MIRFVRVAAILSAGIVAATVAACADVTSPSPITPIEAAAVRSGEEMFRGLVFGEGAVAARLPEVWNGGHESMRGLRGEQLRHIENVKAGLIADIRAADAAFFTRFGNDVQSGDHLRIERALDESSALVKQVTDKHRGIPEARPGDVGTGTCVGVAVFIVGAAVAVFVLAVNHNVAANENWVYNKHYLWPKLDEPQSRLGRDQVIHMMAARFAVR